MSPQELLQHDVNEDGETGGYYGVSTLVHPIQSIQRREREPFVRIAFDPGGAFFGEVRIPITDLKKLVRELEQ